MTTSEPGASEVFTHGLTVRPLATALRASNPAPSITAGLEVLVQDVMAAITTAPSVSSTVSPRTVVVALPGVAALVFAARTSAIGFSASAKLAATDPSSTRSCGRLGPASEGLTVPMSSSTTEL